MDTVIRQTVMRRLVGAGIGLFFLLIVGSAGYALIEGMTPINAFYMAVITISTVGFGEVDPLTPQGRLFTVLLIFAGGGIAAYSVSTAAEFVVSGDWRVHLDQRRHRKMLERLTNHTIICGYGRIGRHVVDELQAQGESYVVLDLDPGKVGRLRDAGHLAIVGNGADEDDLHEAGIARARALAATANSDAENVFIVLSARSMRPDLVIIARANYDDSEAKLLRAGATRVILPYRISGRRMAAMLSRPGVADFLDEVMHTSALELLLDEIFVGRESPLVGQTLGQALLRSRFGITVIACRLPGASMDTSPGADTVLHAGSQLIVLGTREQLQALNVLARGAVS